MNHQPSSGHPWAADKIAQRHTAVDSGLEAADKQGEGRKPTVADKGAGLPAAPRKMEEVDKPGAVVHIPEAAGTPGEAGMRQREWLASALCRRIHRIYRHPQQWLRS